MGNVDVSAEAGVALREVSWLCEGDGVERYLLGLVCRRRHLEGRDSGGMMLMLFGRQLYRVSCLPTLLVCSMGAVAY